MNLFTLIWITVCAIGLLICWFVIRHWDDRPSAWFVDEHADYRMCGGFHPSVRWDRKPIDEE